MCSIRVVGREAFTRNSRKSRTAAAIVTAKGSASRAASTPSSAETR